MINLHSKIIVLEVSALQSLLSSTMRWHPALSTLSWTIAIPSYHLDLPLPRCGPDATICQNLKSVQWMFSNYWVKQKHLSKPNRCGPQQLRRNRCERRTCRFWQSNWPARPCLIQVESFSPRQAPSGLYKILTRSRSSQFVYNLYGSEMLY
jgi:hypothetical protein